jgi:23S rRNA-intervening sequence protein
MKIHFDHEKLDVYVQSIDFCGWVGGLLDAVSGRAAAKDQLDRASTSIPLNIAEGNGKFSDAVGQDRENARIRLSTAIMSRIMSRDPALPNE